MNALKLTREELVGEPEERKLATGKSILSFNVKISDKIAALNTGNRFDYRNELYEIMNKEPVNSPVSYIKFNCIQKTGVNA
ncbi:MAG TPA: hypothetical protein VF721_08560 [Pyrinomonadaceae bacterium]|jgi:hypothetical protein